MALETLNEQQYREIPDKYIDPAVSIQMVTNDYVVRPSATTVPVFITLPPVAEAKGRFYSIVVRDASALLPVIVKDKDDSECWIGDITLNGKCDRLLLYSDGLTWIPVAVIDEASYY